MSDALTEAQAARVELHRSVYWPAAQRAKGNNRLWLTDVRIGNTIAALGVAPLPPPTLHVTIAGKPARGQTLSAAIA